MKIHTSGDWEYWYDRSHGVWRAFRGEKELVNQYHKEELLWVLSTYDHIVDGVYPDVVLTQVSLSA